MKILDLRIVLLLFLMLWMGACGSTEETPEANDYYPFAATANGAIIRWNRGTVINILLPTDESQSSVEGYSASYRVAFLEGISEWDSVLDSMGMRIEYVTEGNNDVRVLWRDGDSVPAGVLGFASINSLAETSRVIVLSTQANLSGNTPHDVEVIRTTVTHEFGHMLGIWNHSFDTNDIMYPFDVGLESLSNRDESTLRRVYDFVPNLNLSSLPNNPGTDETLDLTHAFQSPLTPTFDFSEKAFPEVIFQIHCKQQHIH